jgi:hypothetical protein
MKGRLLREDLRKECSPQQDLKGHKVMRLGGVERAAKC